MTNDTRQYGIIMAPKPVTDRPDRLYMYRFCGLPMGVSMLPRLAARVWRTMTRIRWRPLPERLRTSIANGTIVMSATSLVTSMLPKKVNIISVMQSRRTVDARRSSARPMCWKRPMRL